MLKVDNINSGVLRLDQIISIACVLKQTLLVFFIAHAEHNLIKLKLYNNLTAQAVNNISENAMWNSNGSIKFPHFEN